MPIPRVKLILTPAKQDGMAAAKALMEEFLSSKAVTRRRADWTHDPDTGQTVVELEFGSLDALYAFRQWVADNRTLIRANVRGVLKACLCSHEDAKVEPCRDGVKSGYREVTL